MAWCLVKHRDNFTFTFIHECHATIENEFTSVCHAHASMCEACITVGQRLEHTTKLIQIVYVIHAWGGRKSYDLQPIL
jgi:hypothetical protein